MSFSYSTIKSLYINTEDDARESILSHKEIVRRILNNKVWLSDYIQLLKDDNEGTKDYLDTYPSEIMQKHYDTYVKGIQELSEHLTTL